MISQQKISIIIPVHNEEKVIEKNINQIIIQLRKCQDLNWELLIIENGSNDSTAKLAEKLSNKYEKIKYYSLIEKGYGKALKYGFQMAEGDILINFDIDYWDIEFLKITSHVMQIKYDIIIASKNLLLSEDKRGFLRKITSYGFRMILFFLFGLRVSDTHGIKAWRNSEKIKKCFSESVPSHHTYDTEIIIRAMHCDCEVLEIPVKVVETRESDRHIIKRIPLALKEILSMFFRIRNLKKH